MTDSNKCKGVIFVAYEKDMEYGLGYGDAYCVKCRHKIRLAFPLIEEMYKWMKKARKDDKREE